MAGTSVRFTAFVGREWGTLSETGAQLTVSSEKVEGSVECVYFCLHEVLFMIEHARDRRTVFTR